MFYDLDAATHRTSYWMWGCSPSVTMLLRASELEEFSQESERIKGIAEQIGKASLRFLCYKPSDPMHDVMISRWDRKLGNPDIYRKAITIADSLFAAKWSWIPLYEATGDSRYLELTRSLCESTDKLMDQFEIIPHSFWFDYGDRTNMTINETGFGMEGFAEIYRVTGDKRYQEIGRRFIQQHLDVFQREDGVWERTYYLDSKATRPTEYHTRGQGWAMEGLLASYELLREQRYLDMAAKMGDRLIGLQQSDGSWAFHSDRPSAEFGVSEKGTAIWSYLLYRLYNWTGDPRHLEAARKALIWCLDNQYSGPDREAIGGIVGNTSQSAVGYRRWFNVACAYTSAFFGLALIEELKLVKTD